MSYDGSLKFDTSIDGSGFKSGINNLGNIAKSAMGILAGVVAGGMVALTKTSVDSVARLEQNLGGVETLFKDSADTVIKNAERAYKTAGMSANDYMSTVTSFSASLLQSLGQDTKKAAEYADRALVDMSDNANKMGTDMELIQNAYQGFAKQNYTMLDNLKLGYGGTKTEMQRLIEDAAALKDVQEKLGITVDANSMSFGNIVNAISVMQESMGIAGTTAKEAATTIEGSMSSAKAAWDNFINGTASAEEFAEAFGVAAKVIVENLGEIVPRLAETVPEVAKAIYRQFSTAFEQNGSEMFDTGSQIVADLITGVVKSIPELASAGLSICTSLVTAIGNNVPQLAQAGEEILQYVLDGMAQITESSSGITEQAKSIVSQLMTGIQENAPALLTSGVELLASFAAGIAQNLPELVPQALQVVATLADAVISNIPTIAQAGIGLLKGLIQGIINSLPILISEGPRIINDFADAIYAGVGQLILTGLEMLVSLIQGLWENRGLLLENALAILEAFINIFSLSKLFSLGKSLIQNLVNGIKNLGPNVVKAGGSIVDFLVKGIKSIASNPVNAVKSILTSIKNSIIGIDWKTIGTNIINGIKTGIKNAAKNLAGAAVSAAKDALNSVKKWLGIKSPSRRFRDEVGKMMAQGMGVGFEDNIPTQDMTESMEQSVNKMQKRAQLITQTSMPKTSEIVRNVYNTYDDGHDNPEDQIPIQIHNEFNVDGKKLVDQTTEATIKKINDKQKSQNKTKGVK